MVVPHCYLVALLMTILTMTCWGSWANVVKLVKNWRFELLYFDYALGILLTSAVAGLTLGSMGSYGRPFLDDLAAAGGRNIAFGFLGGVVYNISNILVVGAMAIAGLGVAFPIGVGLALVVGVIWNYFVNPQGNPMLLFTGVAMVVAAIVLDGVAYRVHTMAKAAGNLELKSGKPEGTDKIRKGILLSVIGGLLMGMFFPLVEIGKKGPGGLGPYAIGFVFSVGVFLSTFVFNAYFMKKPVQGEPLRFSEYFRGTSKEHIWGIIGGVVWAVGTLSSFVAASAAAGVAGRTGNQLCARPGLDHDRCLLGRCRLERVCRRRIRREAVAGPYVHSVRERPHGCFHCALVHRALGEPIRH